jgi:hypothetical protein
MKTDLGTGDLGLLHEDHGGGDEGALPHKVDGVVGHGLKECDGLLETGAGARDAQRHGGAVAHVRVVRLGQQRHHARTLLRVPATHTKIGPN